MFHSCPLRTDIDPRIDPHGTEYEDVTRILDATVGIGPWEVDIGALGLVLTVVVIALVIIVKAK